MPFVGGVSFGLPRKYVCCHGGQRRRVRALRRGMLLAAAAKLKDEQARAVLIRTAEIWQRLAAKEDGVPQVQVPGGAVQQQIQPGDDKKE